MVTRKTSEVNTKARKRGPTTEPAARPTWYRLTGKEKEPWHAVTPEDDLEQLAANAVQFEVLYWSEYVEEQHMAECVNPVCDEDCCRLARGWTRRDIRTMSRMHSRTHAAMVKKGSAVKANRPAHERQMVEEKLLQAVELERAFAAELEARAKYRLARKHTRQLRLAMRHSRE